MKYRPLIACVCVLLLAGCRSLRDMKNFSRCEFRLERIEAVQLAGQDITGLQSWKELNMLQAGNILRHAMQQKQLPLQLTFRLAVYNPNQARAALNRIDYELWLFGKKAATGSSGQRMEIEGGQTASFSMSIESDLWALFQGQDAKEVAEKGFRLRRADGKAGDEVALRLKPYIRIFNKQIAYPGYVHLP
ncbi:DNA gyrase inhibitor GyrI [Thermonema lapsum]|jgi:hypothetical protein|uniref:DNA gyrase inhibitor GyrI n=1 Tax=Thermonema lapsum TaxID=28195 RepID=A0A846MRI4_9BACT|nr:LEA type 2 family protein [Thermonema lapsum]NIK74041.1 DNA gyrase inhibitor GyrI [Thermonema lapsum]